MFFPSASNSFSNYFSTFANRTTKGGQDNKQFHNIQFKKPCESWPSKDPVIALFLEDNWEDFCATKMQS